LTRRNLKGSGISVSRVRSVRGVKDQDVSCLVHGHR
jgi:hypothetical protein